MILAGIVMLGLGIPALMTLFAGSAGVSALGALALEFMIGAGLAMMGGFIL